MSVSTKLYNLHNIKSELNATCPHYGDKALKVGLHKVIGSHVSKQVTWSK